MRGFVSLFHTKVFKIGLLVALFITAALIAIAMILGKESGFFTIRVQNGDALKSLTMALDPNNEKDYSTNLSAKAVDDFDQTSPTYLFKDQFAEITKIHKGIAGDISVDEEKIYGYSFYVVNTTSNHQEITARFKLTMSKDDGLSDAIRVMTYYEMGGTQNFNVYQKVDKEPKTYDAYTMIEARNALREFKDGSSVIFDDEEIVISGTPGINNIRYTILFWLEGEDPECTEEILGKSARFELEADVVM